MRIHPHSCCIGFFVSMVCVASACEDGITDPAENVELRCSERPDTSVVTFEDRALRDVVMAELDVDRPEALTCGLVGTLERLWARGVGIRSLAGIEDLTGLRGLAIHDNAISDLRPLAWLTRLTFLDVSRNPIDDLDPISGLTSMDTLAVVGTVVTDVGPLRGLSGLSVLYIGRSDLSEIGPLGDLTGLSLLWLTDNEITDIGPLGALTNLQVLFLDDNAITDISPLRGLTQLENLNLFRNSVVDIGALTDLRRLRDLSLGSNPDLRDIQPLFDNGLPDSELVRLKATSVSCADVARLEAIVPAVISDCP